MYIYTYIQYLCKMLSKCICVCIRVFVTDMAHSMKKKNKNKNKRKGQKWKNEVCLSLIKKNSWSYTSTSMFAWTGNKK